ncbi:MAG: SLC13 family permease, partial [Paludibacteraceae bacterium]
FIAVTAAFSAFMSNTATAAMMLTILAPILRELPANGRGKIGMALAIPVAANIGGMGTPIGTPPNAIALKFLNDPDGLNLGIGFGEWAVVMIPFVIVILLFSWQLLLRLFPFSTDKIEIEIEGTYRKDTKSVIVYVTFALTVILWMLDKVTGLDANVVALIPVAVFCVTGILTKDDLREISWDVLWLVAGGFALGVGLSDTGLAKHMISAIPFDTWSPVLVIVGSGFLCCLMSEFMSNTATAALLMPILAAVGVGMGGTLEPYGGMSSLLVGIAVSASLAMALPISTPPNALAHSTGLTQQKDMAKVGIIVGVVGMVLGYLMLFFLGRIHWFN